MAVCCPRGGEHASDDGRGSKTCFSPCPEGQALRPTGLLTSGSHACGLLPRRRTFISIPCVQWLHARGVPGDSGGGRAGFSPPSPCRTGSKRRKKRHAKRGGAPTSHTRC